MLTGFSEECLTSCIVVFWRSFDMLGSKKLIFGTVLAMGGTHMAL